MDNYFEMQVGEITQLKLKITRNDDDAPKLCNEKCCNVEIHAQNNFFNYSVSGDLLVESELDEIITTVSDFVEGKINSELYCCFYSPELEFEFHESDNDDPDGDYMGLKLKIMNDIHYPYEYYCIWLNRKEAKELNDYLLKI